MGYSDIHWSTWKRLKRKGYWAISTKPTSSGFDGNPQMLKRPTFRADEASRILGAVICSGVGTSMNEVSWLSPRPYHFHQFPSISNTCSSLQSSNVAGWEIPEAPEVKTAGKLAKWWMKKPAVELMTGGYPMVN